MLPFLLRRITRLGGKSHEEYGADLFNGTRGSTISTTGPNANRESNPLEDSAEAAAGGICGKVALLKDWQEGVTGRIQFSVKIKEVNDEELPMDSSDENTVEADYSRKILKKSSDHELSTIPSPEIKAENPNPINKTFTLCLEVEKCINLKNTITNLNSINPMAILRLDDEEIGRTPALKNTRNPIWYDELFEFPIRGDCKILSLEVWNGASASAGSIKETDFIGRCMIDISSLKNTQSCDESFDTHILKLKKWRNTEIEGITNVRSTCQSSHFVRGGGDEDGDLISEGDQEISSRRGRDRSKTIHIRRPTGISESFRKNRLNSVTIMRPDGDAVAPNLYKVVNSDPFRRKEIREFKEGSGREPFYSSTSFKAMSLIMIYMSVGVLGFSLVFERWSLRDSIYFSVVTFTTVGYGDIRPATQGGKLFSCFFAFMGIGIIGVALGYIGQNLIQAQVRGLQKKPKSAEKDAVDNRKGKSRNFTDIPRKIVTFFLPLIAMVGLGAGFVGSIEGWSWVDSIYWCIMTGTSVGYGDFTPGTDSTIWFSVFFIPLAVGIMSAQLGRIANIFVEREISKANTKLLNREVTLEDLEAMNADGDGDVSPLEFVEHMLLVMNKVDQQLLNELHAQFRHLDADGSGGLQQDDLEILTTQKLTEYRTRALKKYKDNLLDPSMVTSMPTRCFSPIFPS